MPLPLYCSSFLVRDWVCRLQTHSFVSMQIDTRGSQLTSTDDYCQIFGIMSVFRSVVTMFMCVVAITFGTFRPQGMMQRGKCATLRAQRALAAEWRNVAKSGKSQAKSQH